MTDVPFCCAACRLLQDPAASCVECGSVIIGRLDTEQELLRWNSLSVSPTDGRGVRSRTVSAIDLPSPPIAHEAIGAGSLFLLGRD